LECVRIRRRTVPECLPAFLAVSGAATPGKADKKGILETYGKLPLYFIENKGQLEARVRFYVKPPGHTLYFTDEAIVFDLLRREKEGGKGTEGAEKSCQTKGIKTERLVFNLGFENVRESVLIEGLNRQNAGINYFVGNDRSKWKRGIPTCKGVVYKGIYKGIDLKVFGNGKDIEYEFVVNPGGNPDDILLTYNGIEGLSTNGEGELLIATAFGEFKETRPYIYQEIEGKRAVDGSFEIRSPTGQSQTRNFSYGFQVASYDPSYPLIIDPTLSYSTYLGGSADDRGNGIAVDGSGNAYVTGYTDSIDFSTQNSFQRTNAGNRDAFVTKLGDTISPTIPIVTTATASSITSTEATSGGNVTFDGGASVTAKGVCWSTASNPITSDSHTSDGTGTGSFTSTITGLNPETTCHVRAYATNSEGTGYGSDLTFKTSCESILYVSIGGDCGDKTPCYDSIQEAIDAASTGSVILIAEGIYDESLVLSESKVLILQGGWNSEFTIQSLATTVNSITISNGTVAVDKLVLQ